MHTRDTAFDAQSSAALALHSDELTTSSLLTTEVPRLGEIIMMVVRAIINPVAQLHDRPRRPVAFFPIKQLPFAEKTVCPERPVFELTTEPPPICFLCNK